MTLPTRVLSLKQRREFFIAEENNQRTSVIEEFDRRISHFSPDLTLRLPPVRIDPDGTNSSTSGGSHRPRSLSQGSNVASKIPKPTQQLKWNHSMESVEKTAPTPPPRRKISATQNPLDFQAKPARQSPAIGPMIDDELYNMQHGSRGKVIIINHSEFSDNLEKRDGTEVDATNLKNSLPKLGFLQTDIDTWDNLPLSTLNKRLNDLSEENFAGMDCLMIFVLTHGDGDKIWARDTDYHVDKIWKPFTGDKCRTLIGKPKLFFIVACKGERTDTGVSTLKAQGGDLRRPSTSHDATPTQHVNYTIPAVSDMLIVYSTFPGFVSFRERDRGTWYIEALCEEINKIKSGQEINFSLFLTRVNRKVATAYTTYHDDPKFHNKKQCPFVTSTLIRNIMIKIK